MSADPAAPATSPAAAARRRRKGGILAVVFALAAAFACWNPVSAPFAIVVGVGAAILAWRARRRGARPVLAWSALALGLLAAIAGGALLGFTGKEVLTELPGRPVVTGRSLDEVSKALDDAAARTRDERERARKELERTEGK